jgi:hypothetical protein
MGISKNPYNPLFLNSKETSKKEPASESESRAIGQNLLVPKKDGVISVLHKAAY